MNLSPEDKAILERSEVYQYYRTTQYSSITTALILADLDAIKSVSLETLPIIKFLTELYRNKVLEDVDASLGTSAGTFLELIADNMNAEVGYPTTTHIHDETYFIEMVAVTLSSGASANAEILAAVAGKKFNVIWFVPLWDTAPGTDYTFDWHQASGSTIVDARVNPPDCGEKRYVYLDTTTVNTALQCSIGGGAGTEVVYIIVCYCRWS